MTLNFLDPDVEYTNEEQAKIVIMPVPYDGTSTWIKGADNGPQAIIEASCHVEQYDISTDTEVHKQGIYTADYVIENRSPEAMVAAVYEQTKAFLNKDKFIVTLGGEHSVSIGVIQAYAEAFSNMTVLQFDAHSDTREYYHGSKNNHACVMARVREHSPIIQVGIRSMDQSEKAAIDPTRMFYAHQIQQQENWQQAVLDLLTDHVYITIDLDAFDPSIMASVGTPEPNGLLYQDVLDLIAQVQQRSCIVGFDVVELCPNPNNKSPDYTAAQLTHQILCLCFQDS